MSVIIPALNAEASVERCVRSLFEQTLPPLEVLVVDNGSNDQTPLVAERAGARVISEKRRGRSRARNRGVRESRGNVLAFMDADCAAPADWLSSSVAALRAPWLAAVQARVQKSGLPPPGRRFVQAHDYWPFLDTCALVASRFAVDAAGGFDEELPRVEDMDFSFRLLASGFAFAWLPDTIVQKQHELSRRDALERGWVGGISAALLSDKWHETMGRARLRICVDLSKALLLTALRETRAPRATRGTATVEALGRVLGSVRGELFPPRIAGTFRVARTVVREKLGARRFLVVGPDESIFYDAVARREVVLDQERSQALIGLIEDGPNTELGERVSRELALQPGT